MRRPRLLRCRSGVVVALVAAVALLVASCAGSGYKYVRNSHLRTYFKVPDRWALFSQDDIVIPGAAVSPQQAAQQRAQQWLVAFDADPRPSVEHILNEQAAFPTGLVRVRVLPKLERETLSLASLRNEVLPIDEYLKGNGEVQVLEREDVLQHGLRGVRQVHNIHVQGGFFTVDQTALVDPATRLVYVIALGCEARCYLQNHGEVEEIMRSWTVKSR